MFRSPFGAVAPRKARLTVRSDQPVGQAQIARAGGDQRVGESRRGEGRRLPGVGFSAATSAAAKASIGGTIAGVGTGVGTGVGHRGQRAFLKQERRARRRALSRCDR